MQRFISQDPIGFAGGDTNLYAYIFNSPTNYFDPTGQFGWPVHERITKDSLQRAGLPPDPAMASGRCGLSARFTRTRCRCHKHARHGWDDNGQEATQTNVRRSLSRNSKPNRAGFQLRRLTKALHTIQDAYSPSHYPFRFWDGGYTSHHIPGLGHMEGDFFPPESAVEAATNASTQFLRDILDHPNGPVDPRKYLPTNPCGD